MPLTDDQVRETFGDPAPFLGPDGEPRSSWPAQILVLFELPAPLQLSNELGVATHVRAHWKIASLMRAALVEIYMDPIAWGSIHDFEGCYAWRAMRGAHELSRHAWGIAVDMNAVENPFGGKPTMSPAIVSAFSRWGFEWGGNWTKRVDGMHFEFSDLSKLPANAKAPA